jgi:hypothetical protein
VSKKSEAELAEARDENTSHARLQEIWNTSRSVRVRKAVASNPNADPSVLRSAARLYLDEVVKNPGFEMLHLFDTGDEWIRDVSLAYQDPGAFLMSRSSYFWSRGSVEAQLKACLLSDKLSSWVLNRVIDSISSSGLKRTIKNAEVKKRIRLLLMKELNGSGSWPFDLGCIIRLYTENVLNDEELRLAMANYGVGSCSYRKGSYVRFMSTLYKKYREAEEGAEKALFVELISRITLISRSYTLGWSDDVFYKDALLEWSGELYSRVFKIIANNRKNRFIISDNITWVGKIVTAYIKAKFLASERTDQVYSKEKLEEIHRFIKDYDLTNEQFNRFGFLVHGKEGPEELSKCHIEAKEFFIRAGCLGTWVSTSSKDPKYLIAEEVNNYLYERDGIGDTLLFNKCSVRKIVTLNDSTHIC